jgi:hypothetical protein
LVKNNKYFLNKNMTTEEKKIKNNMNNYQNKLQRSVFEDFIQSKNKKNILNFSEKNQKEKEELVHWIDVIEKK